MEIKFAREVTIHFNDPGTPEEHRQEARVNFSGGFVIVAWNDDESEIFESWPAADVRFVEGRFG